MKRSFLHGGYAQPVHEFIKEIDSEKTTFFHPTDGRFLVNLSFDLEFALNTRFWEQCFEKALCNGRRAREFLMPVLGFLTEERIPHNVQILGALLDKNFLSRPFVSKKHREIIEANMDLFLLRTDEITLLQNSYTEIGLHGLSHRQFTELSKEEVDLEIDETSRLLEKTFGEKPTFMSFPKNSVAHTGVLSSRGTTSWRTDTQIVSQAGEIPLGLWFAPGILDEEDLRKLARHIKNTRQGFFLHLWNHFLEINPQKFRALIRVLQDEEWEFVCARDYIKRA